MNLSLLAFTTMTGSNHTITFLPAGRTASTIISKRDLGHNPDDQPCCSKWPIRNTQARKQTSEEENETPIELNQQIENEQPKKNEMPTEREMTNEGETTNQSEPPPPGPIKNQTAKQNLKQLKKKAKQQQQKNKLKREKAWLKQLDTIISESNGEEEPSNEEGQTTGG